MSSCAAIFFLLICFLSLHLHACNGRILSAEHFDRRQGTGPKAIMEIMGSGLQVTDTASSLETLSAITEEHPIILQNGGYVRSRENVEIGTPTLQERRLQEKNVAAQEIDYSDDSKDVVEDAVVMDYATPHRKPPIHNEEN